MEMDEIAQRHVCRVKKKKRRQKSELGGKSISKKTESCRIIKICCFLCSFSIYTLHVGRRLDVRIWPEKHATSLVKTSVCAQCSLVVT